MQEAPVDVFGVISVQLSLHDRQMLRLTCKRLFQALKPGRVNYNCIVTRDCRIERLLDMAPDSSKVVKAFYRRGCLDCIKYMQHWFHHHSTPELIDLAIIFGQVRVVNWLNEVGKCPNVLFDNYFTAVRAGNVFDIFDSMYDPEAMFYIANACGHLHILQRLKKECKSLGYASNCILQASAYGHLHIVRWLYENNMDSDFAQGGRTFVDACVFCIFEAAQNNHFHVVKWLGRLFKRKPSEHFHNYDIQQINTRCIPRHIRNWVSINVPYFYSDHGHLLFSYN